LTASGTPRCCRTRSGRGNSPRRPTPSSTRASRRASTSSGGELRDDLPPVDLERLFLAVRHQVDVELVDADRLQLAQLLDGLLGRAEDAEALDDVVGHELAVRRADA